MQFHTTRPVWLVARYTAIMTSISAWHYGTKRRRVLSTDKVSFYPAFVLQDKKPTEIRLLLLTTE